MSFRPARPSGLESRTEKLLLLELCGLLADYPGADDETLAVHWEEKRDYARATGAPDPFAEAAEGPGFAREFKRVLQAARAKARQKAYAKVQRAKAREHRMARQSATPAQLRLLAALARRYDLRAPAPLEGLNRLEASQLLEAWLARRAPQDVPPA